MKLKELKKWVNSLTNEQLNQELMYNSEELSVSGKVQKIAKAKSNLYFTGEDDPSTLKTKNALLKDGLDKEEIEMMTIEIPKGGFYITF